MSKCEKFKRAWVNGGSIYDSLKVASALNVKVMEIPTSVVASELWLRDDLEEVCALLVRFLWNSFLPALSNVGWLVTQKFVILVPDPIVHAPWSVLLDCTASFVSLVNTSSLPPFAGLYVKPRIKDDMGDGVPTDQLSHKHCDCADSHCKSHIVASCVIVLLVPTAITRRRRRVPSTMSTSPSSSARASLVSFCQDTSRKGTLPGRAP